MRTRLSYQQQDERWAFSLAAALRRVGADVVLDAWRDGSSSQRTPDRGSCPDTDAVVVMWSAAAQAAWGDALAESSRRSGFTGTGEARVVPVRLDDTPLPPSLGGLRHLYLVQGTDRMSDTAATMIVHLGSTAVPAPAVRGDICEHAVVISDFGPLGLFVACPRCGVSSDRLRPYITVDHLSDSALRLVICGACGWQDACDL